MLPLYLTMLILTYVLAPILGFLSILLNINKYPFPLNFFHTIDDDLDGGQHQLDWNVPSTKFGLGWQRTMWIWRNPASGFNCVCLGLKVSKTKLTILVDNFPNDDLKQYRKSVLENHGLKFFEFLNTLKWGLLIICFFG